MAKYEKGWKGGPGRPKGSGYVEFCQKWAEKEGWQLLADAAAGKAGFTEKKVRMTAIQTLLAYGYGRPKETLDVNLAGDLAVQLAASRARSNPTHSSPA